MRIGVKVFLAAALAVVACGGGDEPAAPSNNGATGATGTTGATGNTGSTSNAITVSDNSFAPAATTVAAGTTITWTWTGLNAHNVTFSTAGIAGSGDRSTGTFQRQFPTAGAFGYECTRHPGMTGTVTVQ